LKELNLPLLKAMTHIYCGNNRNNPDLRSGKYVKGTRRICLRKGIGVGLAEPLDKDYSVPYAPISGRKLYCGDKRRLPEGYDAFGNNAECLQIGVGIGKSMKYEQGILWGEKWNFLRVFIVTLTISILTMYINKPSYVVEKKKNSDEIVWTKLILISIGISVGVTLVIIGLKLLM